MSLQNVWKRTFHKSPVVFRVQYLPKESFGRPLTRDELRKDLVKRLTQIDKGHDTIPTLKESLPSSFKTKFDVRFDELNENGEFPSFSERLIGTYLSSKRCRLSEMKNIGINHHTIRKHERESSSQINDEIWYSMSSEIQLFQRLNDEIGDSSKLLLNMCLHYDIFKDFLLRKNSFFHSIVPLNIFHDINNENSIGIFSGNILKNSQLINFPKVEWKTEKLREVNKETKWTFLIGNLDGNYLTNDESIFIQYLKKDICGSSINGGEKEEFSYIPPTVAKGTGFHRIIYVLLKQEQSSKIEMTNEPDNELVRRTIKLEKLWEILGTKSIPVAIRFSQCQWDEQTKNTFENFYNMDQLIYEAEQPLEYVEKQKNFPNRHNFVQYLNKYRDRKETNKTILTDQLKNHKILNELPELPSSYLVEMEDELKSKPYWFRKEMEKKFKKEGKWKLAHLT
ncbi:hypothetical protein SNEBB_000102 [Seison nebaliae]|nr:hypothetical protein SNEBB_000102 [Seison nebaliae]